jgi:hypothetical protein
MCCVFNQDFFALTVRFIGAFGRTPALGSRFYGCIAQPDMQDQKRAKEQQQVSWKIPAVDRVEAA